MVEIKELVNIEEKGDGQFVANFKVEERSSVDVDLDSLRMNAKNYEEDIQSIDNQIADLNRQVKDLTDRKQAVQKSLNVINGILNKYPVEEPVVEVENGPQLDQNGNVIQQ